MRHNGETKMYQPETTANDPHISGRNVGTDTNKTNRNIHDKSWRSEEEGEYDRQPRRLTFESRSRLQSEVGSVTEAYFNKANSNVLADSHNEYENESADKRSSQYHHHHHHHHHHHRSGLRESQEHHRTDRDFARAQSQTRFVLNGQNRRRRHVRSDMIKLQGTISPTSDMHGQTPVNYVSSSSSSRHRTISDRVSFPSMPAVRNPVYMNRRMEVHANEPTPFVYSVNGSHPKANRYLDDRLERMQLRRVAKMKRNTAERTQKYVTNEVSPLPLQFHRGDIRSILKSQDINTLLLTQPSREDRHRATMSLHVTSSSSAMNQWRNRNGIDLWDDNGLGNTDNEVPTTKEILSSGHIHPRPSDPHHPVQYNHRHPAQTEAIEGHTTSKVVKQLQMHNDPKEKSAKRVSFRNDAELAQDSRDNSKERMEISDEDEIIDHLPSAIAGSVSNANYIYRVSTPIVHQVRNSELISVDKNMNGYRSFDIGTEKVVFRKPQQQQQQLRGILRRKNSARKMSDRSIRGDIRRFENRVDVNRRRLSSKRCLVM